MPPKRKGKVEPPVQRDKKLRTMQNAGARTKMAAQRLNAADLRALLQTTLEQQGDSLDPTGYAYVSVEAGSNYAVLQSQDPLGDAEVPSPLETSNTFLEGLAVDHIDEGEAKYEIDPKSPSKASESFKLVAQNLSVAELREMLQAALQHEVSNPAGSSQSLDRMVRIDETQDLVSTVRKEATLEHFGSLNKPYTSNTDKSVSLGMEISDGSPHTPKSQPVAHTGEPNTIMVEIVQRYSRGSDGHYNDSQDMLDNENQQAHNESLQRSQDRRPLVERNENPSIHPNLDSIGQEASTTDDGGVHDWESKYKQLEKRFNDLSEKHKKCKQKFAQLEAAKLAADDYSLRLVKEMMEIKDKHMIKQVRFTEENGISITIAELEQLNGRAETDSMFVGLLITRLIGPEKLTKMSVTGQASHRFSKVKNPDGTPKYPAAEGMEPKLIEFICNKVAERTAMKIGPDNLATIRKRSEVTLIKKYIGQKIANLRKAADVRNARSAIDPQDAGNIRV